MIAVMGNIAHITAEALDKIFDIMASKSLQKASSTRRSIVNSVETGSDLTQEMAQMMREMNEMKMKQAQSPSPSKEFLAPSQEFAAPPQDFSMQPCGIRLEMGHTADVCPNMGAPAYEGGAEAYAMQGFSPRQPYEPRASYEQAQLQYNSRWKQQYQGPP